METRRLTGKKLIRNDQDQEDEDEHLPKRNPTQLQCNHRLTMKYSIIHRALLITCSVFQSKPDRVLRQDCILVYEYSQSVCDSEGHFITLMGTPM